MKLSTLIQILCIIGCSLCLLLFGRYAYDDIKNSTTENFGSLFILLCGFWFFFFIGFTIFSEKKMQIPEEGRRIRITWLPHCINVPSNVPNPYIGMEGYVRELKPDGSFHLQCETSWLIVFGKYKFEYLD